MQEKLFYILMPLEFFFALVSVAMLFPDVGAIIFLIAAAVFVAVLAPFWRRLKRSQDEAEKRKLRRNMALILLFPIAAGVIAFLVVAVALCIALT